VEKSRLRPLCY
jgi:hypothetical protein